MQTIYNNFDSIYEIITFISHCASATSGFKRLKPLITDPQDSPYTSRGILQVTGLENYQFLGIKYVNNPDLLCSLDIEPTVRSIALYHHLCRDVNTMNFTDTLKCLAPQEAQSKNYQVQKYRIILSNRQKTYERLCEAVGIEPAYGRHLELLPNLQ